MFYKKIFVILLANSEKSCTFAPAFEKKREVFFMVKTVR